MVQIRVPTLSGDEEIQNLQNGLEAELSQIYPEMDTETATASYVGPVAGATLVRNAVISVLLATVLMLAYIALRFDFASGLAAVIGLLHDVLIMIAFMVILRSVIQMNSSFIAAMLTIVGYSINNTIVIFDRIRENNKKPAYAGMKREEVVSISVRESLGRTYQHHADHAGDDRDPLHPGRGHHPRVQPAHHYRHSGGRLQRQHDQRLCMGCSGGTADRPQEPEKAQGQEGVSVFSKRLCQRPSEHYLFGGVICLYAICP